MEKLTVEEVSAALQEWLGPMAKVDLSRDGAASRITGWIMHPSFTGVTHAIRQSWLWHGFGDEGQLPEWQGLRGRFKERASQIGLILTYSPAEYEHVFNEAETA